MKVSNLKSILFSLLTVTFLTVSLTSCEREQIQETASDTEVMNELFRLASEQIDFSTNDEKKVSVSVSYDDLSPSVFRAIQERGLNINEGYTIENSKQLFCSSQENCPIVEDLAATKSPNSINSRGCWEKCFTKWGVEVCVTVCCGWCG